MHRTRHADLSPRRWQRLMVGLLAAAVPAAAGQTKPPLPLGRMLSIVADSSNVAVVGDLDTAQARAATEQVSASYRPTVELKGGYTARDSPIVAIFGNFSAPLGSATFWQAQLSARELLWDGGRRAKAVEAGEHAVAAASAGRDARVLRTQIEGMGAYLQAVLAHARQRVVEQRIKALEAHMKDARNLYDQGMAARNDLLETRVRLRSVEDRRPELDNRIAVSLQTLNRLMGRDPGIALAVPESLAAPPPLPAPREALFEEAAEHNPELIALAAQLESARSRREVESRESSPKLVVSAAHTYEENPFLEYNHANLAMLGLSWKLYDGGARRQRVTIAHYQVEKIRRNLEDTRRRLATRFDRAFRRYRQALRVAETAKANVDAALENLRIVSDQYRAGLARGSDVLDAEALLSAGRFTLAESHLAAYLQQATVLAVAGRDLPSFYETVGATPVEDRHE